MNSIKSNIIFSALGIAIGILAANSFNHSTNTQNNIENNNFNLSFEIPQQNSDSIVEQNNNVDIAFLQQYSKSVCNSINQEAMKNIHNGNYVLDACKNPIFTKNERYIM